MSTYKLRLIHTVSDAEGYFSILWKDYELPFVPWVGLTIADWNAGFNTGGLAVEKLVWSTTLMSFVGQTDGEKCGDSKSQEDSLKSLLSEGWSDSDLD